jgi:chemotaxis signal transduction protein
MRVLIVPVHSEFYAVPMANVQQVMRHPQVTRVPLAPRGLIGVVNVRGEILPLLDTGVLTGSGPLTSPPYAVLISSEKENVAIAAEDMPMAADFDQPVAPTTRTGELGVYSSGGRLVTLLSVEDLVANNQPEEPRAS